MREYKFRRLMNGGGKATATRNLRSDRAARDAAKEMMADDPQIMELVVTHGAAKVFHAER